MVSSTEVRRQVKEMFREWDALVEPLTTPIVYHPGGWEDTIPDELKREVIKQRLEKQLNGGWDKATDAEVMCYLSTCSLVQPLTSDWTQIFLYVSALFMPQIRDAIPDTPKELTDNQQSELGELKRKIRASQIRRRKQSSKGGNMPKRKLVVEEREGSVLMGFQQEGCDPEIKTVEGTFEAALAEIPQFLTEAHEKWVESPKNPKYTPPKAPSRSKTPAPAPAATPETAGDLPLLAGKDQPAPEAVPTEAPTEALTEEPTEAPTEAVAPGVPVEGEPGHETPVFPVEETPAVEEGQPQEPDLEPTPDQESEAALEEETGHLPPFEVGAPEPPNKDIDAGEFAEVPSEMPPPEETAVEETPPAVAQALREREEEGTAAAPAPAPRPARKLTEWKYYLLDERGPFADIQKAMDAMGLDKEDRPHHNRWDRLSTQMKAQILRRAQS